MEIEVDGQLYHSKIEGKQLIPPGAVHAAHRPGGVIARWIYGYRRS